MAGTVLIIFGWLLIAFAVGYSFSRIRQFNKTGGHEFTKPLIKDFLLAVVASLAGGILSNIGYALSGSWPIDPGHYVMLLVGSAFFYPAVLAFGVTFYFRYWRTDLAEKCKKNRSEERRVGKEC